MRYFSVIKKFRRVYPIYFQTYEIFYPDHTYPPPDLIAWKPTPLSVKPLYVS